MTTYTDRQKACIAAIQALFQPAPDDELGPTDEPESQYRFGYNTALEDALSAVEKSITAFSEPAGAGDVRGELAGYFLNCAADGDKSHYLPVGDEHKDNPDVLALYLAASQADLDDRTELEVRASLWDEVRAICVPHGAGVDKPITEWLEDRLTNPSQPAAPAVDFAVAQGEPVATLHDDGHYTWRGAKPHDFNYAGWRMDVYAPLPRASDAQADEVAVIDACIAENGLEATQRAAKMILAARRDAQAATPAALADPNSPEAHGLPPYPTGNVVGPCVCGSWPGGECLKCAVIPAPATAAQGAMNRDEQRLALWSAINAIKFGSPTDDKVLLDSLHKLGFVVSRFAAPTPVAHTDLLADYIELNMSNYDQDDVSRLNEWAIKAYTALAAAKPVSVDAVQAAFDRGLKAGNEQSVKQQECIHRLQDTIDELRNSVSVDAGGMTSHADMFWPEDDGEQMYHSLDDAVTAVFEDSGAEAGQEFEFTCAARLPKAKVRIIEVTENGFEWEEVITPASDSATPNETGEAE